MDLRNLVYQLWEELEGMNLNDDSLYNYSYLRDKIIAMHPTIIKEAERERLALEGFYQILPCVGLRSMGHRCTVEGMTFHLDTGLWMADLPPLIKTIGRKNVRYFGIAGFEKDIEIVSMEAFRCPDGARFTALSPRVMILGDKAIVRNLPSTGFRMAVVTAILNDPTRACDWPADDAREFPTASATRLMIAVKRDILSMLGRPDLVNDAQVALGPEPRAPVQNKGEQ